MANKGRLSFEKRQREIKKKEKRQEKLERRIIRKEAKLNGTAPSTEPVVTEAAMPDQASVSAPPLEETTSEASAETSTETSSRPD